MDYKQFDTENPWDDKRPDKFDSTLQTLFKSIVPGCQLAKQSKIVLDVLMKHGIMKLATSTSDDEVIAKLEPDDVLILYLLVSNSSDERVDEIKSLYDTMYKPKVNTSLCMKVFMYYFLYKHAPEIVQDLDGSDDPNTNQMISEYNRYLVENGENVSFRKTNKDFVKALGHICEHLAVNLLHAADRVREDSNTGSHQRVTIYPDDIKQGINSDPELDVIFGDCEILNVITPHVTSSSSTRGGRGGRTRGGGRGGGRGRKPKAPPTKVATPPPSDDEDDGHTSSPNRSPRGSPKGSPKRRSPKRRSPKKSPPNSVTVDMTEGKGKSTVKLGRGPRSRKNAAH